MVRALTVNVLIFLLSSIPSVGQPPEPSSAAKQWLERLKQHRLTKAKSMTFAAPFYSIEDGDSELYLVGRSTDPIDVEITAWTRAGKSYSLGFLTLNPTSHTRISLLEALEGAGSEFNVGSLTVDLVGDSDILQGWIVIHRRDGQVTEVPMEEVGAVSAWRLVSFWDASELSSQTEFRAVYHVANFGVAPASVRVERSHSASPKPYEVLQIGPQESLVIVGSEERSSRGWVSFELDGQSNHVLITGFLRGDEYESRLPIHEDAESSVPTDLMSVRVPLVTTREDAPATETSVFLSLFNGSDRTGSITVDVLNHGNGEPLVSHALELHSREIVSMTSHDLFLDAFPLGPPPQVRLRVRSEPVGVLASAVSLDSSGVPFDVSFLHREDGHATGGYPLPSLHDRTVLTTWVNLGNEPSWIGLQYFWADGTYAHGPLEVPPGGSLTIDVESLARTGEPDLLHRTLNPDFDQGFLQWSVRRGSRQLIARTEVRARYANDTFGFNCTTCCPESPFGELTPGSALFEVGSSTPFAATEMVSSCTGTLGPYPVSNPTLTYSSPLSWNASTVSSTQPTQQTARFDGLAEVIDFSCNTRQTNIFDEGPVDAIEVDITDVNLPQDQIKIGLRPLGSGLTGTLKVYLAGPSPDRVLYNAPATAGTLTFSFGDLNGYGEGDEYQWVQARWTVGQQSATTTFFYRFKTLGVYDNTRYNAPVEGQCTGVGVPICHYQGTGSNKCINVASCSPGSSTARSGWVTEVSENGSGQHSVLGVVTRESFCQSQSCGFQVRTVDAPCGSCSGMTLSANGTVAIRAFGHPDLSCGDKVFVEGVGVRTVADTGALAEQQLDHFAGFSGCNAVSSIGPRTAFKIF